MGGNGGAGTNGSNASLLVGASLHHHCHGSRNLVCALERISHFKVTAEGRSQNESPTAVGSSIFKGLVSKFGMNDERKGHIR